MDIAREANPLAEPRPRSCVCSRTGTFGRGILAIDTFSNSSGSNACISPFGNRTTMVYPMPITRTGSGNKRWRTQSPSRNSYCMAFTAKQENWDRGAVVVITALVLPGAAFKPNPARADRLDSRSGSRLWNDHALGFFRTDPPPSRLHRALPSHERAHRADWTGPNGYTRLGKTAVCRLASEEGSNGLLRCML